MLYLISLREVVAFNPKVAGSIPAGPTIFSPGRNHDQPSVHWCREQRDSRRFPISSSSRVTRTDIRYGTGVSSNGRTLVFGTSYLGSNPSTPAILFSLPATCVFPIVRDENSDRSAPGRPSRFWPTTMNSAGARYGHGQIQVRAPTKNALAQKAATAAGAGITGTRLLSR